MIPDNLFKSDKWVAKVRIFSEKTGFSRSKFWQAGDCRANSRQLAATGVPQLARDRPPTGAPTAAPNPPPGPGLTVNLAVGRQWHFL